MKQLKKILTNRISMVAVACISQVAWFIVLILWASGINMAINTVLRVFSLLMFLYAYHKEWHPDYRLAWSVIIIAFPIGGGILYFSYGNAVTSARITKKLLKTTKAEIPYIPQEKQLMQDIYEHDINAFGIANYLGKTMNFPVYKDSDVKYYGSGEAIFPELIRELQKAEKFIFMEYFIVTPGKMWDEIFKILEAKAQSGVDVRFIYDDFGCVMTMPSHFDKMLEEKGIKAACFNKLRPIASAFVNNRDHRKITVIDGNVAVNGGFNLADEYINEYKRFGYWKDSGVVVRGAAVSSFTYMFLSMWNVIRNEVPADFAQFEPDRGLYPREASGYVQPFSDSPLDKEPVAMTVIADIINSSHKYVYLSTPYLIPDSYMMSSLRNAARRGVDVRIVTPGIPDKKMTFLLTRSYYRTLMDAGVKIYQYSPGFIHAKNVVCDDKYALCSTINLDYRSLFLHFECGTFYAYNDAVLALKDDMVNTIALSEEQLPESAKKNPIYRLFMSVLRLFAPLF